MTARDSSIKPITVYRVRAQGIAFQTTDARDAERHAQEGARVTATTTTTTTETHQ